MTLCIVLLSMPIFVMIIGILVAGISDLVSMADSSSSTVEDEIKPVASHRDSEAQAEDQMSMTIITMLLTTIASLFPEGSEQRLAIMSLVSTLGANPNALPDHAPCNGEPTRQVVRQEAREASKAGPTPEQIAASRIVELRDEITSLDVQLSSARQAETTAASERRYGEATEHSTKANVLEARIADIRAAIQALETPKSDSVNATPTLPVNETLTLSVGMTARVNIGSRYVPCTIIGGPSKKGTWNLKLDSGKTLSRSASSIMLSTPDGNKASEVQPVQPAHTTLDTKNDDKARIDAENRERVIAEELAHKAALQSRKDKISSEIASIKNAISGMAESPLVSAMKDRLEVLDREISGLSQEISGPVAPSAASTAKSVGTTQSASIAASGNDREFPELGVSSSGKAFTLGAQGICIKVESDGSLGRKADGTVAYCGPRRADPNATDRVKWFSQAVHIKDAGLLRKIVNAGTVKGIN